MKLSVKSFIVAFTVFFVVFASVFTAVEIGGYKKYRFFVMELCEDKDIKPELVLAVARTESSFNKSAVSKKGAVGIMQLMPSTAEFIAKKVNFSSEIDLYNPETNIFLGVCYLEYLFDRYGDETVVLACYNAGEGIVSKWSDEQIKSPPYKETKDYLRKVKRRKKLYQTILK